MLYKETVEPQTLNILLRLLQDETFRDFYLVGSTALSLQIGHRRSADIDLLGRSNFDVPQLSEYLSKKHHAESIKTFKTGIFCFIDDIKTDLFSQPYPPIKPPATIEGIRMASLEDIGSMKLNAIIQDGSQFIDFLDIYGLLEHLSLEELTDAYETKYPKASRTMAHNALTHHSDIMPASINFIGQEITLKDIAYRLRKAVQEPKRIFESGPTEWQLSKKTKRSK